MHRKVTTALLGAGKDGACVGLVERLRRGDHLVAWLEALEATSELGLPKSVQATIEVLRIFGEEGE